METIKFSLDFGRYSFNRLSVPNPYSSLRQAEEKFAASDTKNLIIQTASEKLKNDSPLTKDFLEKNFVFSQFVARNLGKIADLLNQNKELSQSIVDGGNVVDGPIISDVINKVVDYLGPTSTLNKDFLTTNPEAAIHLLENPSEFQQLKNYPSKESDFMAKIGKNISTYENEIINKAKELLGMPAQFSLDFLEKNKDFSLLVVASQHDDENLNLSQYIRANPKLIQNGEFSTDNLVKSYQIELAVHRFPSNFTLSKDFFQQNEPLAIAVLHSPQLVKNLKEETSLTDKLNNLINRTYQSSFQNITSSSHPNINLFA